MRAAQAGNTSYIQRKDLGQRYIKINPAGREMLRKLIRLGIIKMS